MSSRSSRLKHLLMLLLAAGLLSLVMGGLFQLGLLFAPEAWRNTWTNFQSLPYLEQLSRLKHSLPPDPQRSLLFIGVQLLQVLFAPIPGQFMGLAGGWLFGFAHGLALTMFGLMLGSFLAISIGRWGGKPLLQRFLPESVWERFSHLIEGRLIDYFLLFLLPALPDDALCFLAGLSPLSIRKLCWVCFWGRLPGMAMLTWTGTQVNVPSPWLNGIMIAVGLITLGFWWFQDQAELAFSHWTSGSSFHLKSKD